DYGHYFPPGTGELLCYTPGLCIHGDLSGDERHLHLRPWRVLSARPGRPGTVLQLSSLVVSVHDPGHCHEPVGGRAQDRYHRTADDPARETVGCRAGQVPRGLGADRRRAAADVPDLDHGELPG